jgi:predicted lipoprotein with Yx(FWY)xxD motif
MFARIRIQTAAFALLASSALILAACQPTAAPAAEPTAMVEPTATMVPSAAPTVQVSDQSVDGGQLVVAEVVSAGPGWIVIHADSSGKPGPVLGYSPVKDGLNQNVAVMIDDSEATPVLYAMLHVDAGTVGAYEFPGADGPAMVNGQMVSPAFMVSGISGKSGSSGSGGSMDDLYGEQSMEENKSTPAASSAVTVMVSSNSGLGNFLVDSKGMTLYRFTNDTPGVSNCSGGCLQAWPPLLSDGDPIAGEGVTGRLGVIVRADGSRQVTYNDMPLYYYAVDAKPGDTTGHGVGGVWFVVEP